MSDNDDQTDDLTDEEILARIDFKFRTLKDIVERAAKGGVSGAVVFGAPGVGKTFCVEETLIECGVDFQRLTGKASPGGLYDQLHMVKESGQVLVADDCDSILEDKTSINLLKAVLDSRKVRRVSWNSRQASDTPSSFEFEGSVIFITNTDFAAEAQRGKKIATDLEAILDRTLYLDLTIKTEREKILRIRQVAQEHGMLEAKGLSSYQRVQVLKYFEKNAPRFRQLTVRRLAIIADLCLAGGDWQALADQTSLK